MPALPSEPGAAPYYPALTGLRALAAWLVFLFHFHPFGRGSAGWWLAEQFSSGVGLFFVLSGFLITSRYLGHLQPTRRELVPFFRRRWARIYPLYFLLTLLTVVVYQVGSQYDVDNRYLPYSEKGRLVLLVLNALLVQGFFSEYRFTGLMVSWSLTAEESFYALAPWLLRGLRRHGPGRLLAYAAGLLGLGCALVLLPAPWHRFGFFSSYPFMLEGTFPGRCIEFLGGMYLAWRLAARPVGAARWPVCTVLGLVWWLAGMAAMAMVQAAGSQALGYQWDGLRLLRILLNNVGLVPGFCLLLYGLAHEPSALRRLLASRLFGLLGKASYAFYLLHAGLLTELLHRYVSTSRLVQFGLLNLVAVLLYLGFEKPMNQWLTSRPAASARSHRDG